MAPHDSAAQQAAPRMLGLIGLGLLGSALAQRWLDSGWLVVGFDLRSERREQLGRCGGRAVESAEEVWRQCHTLGICVPDSEATAEVLSHCLQHDPGERRYVLDFTTGDPRRMAEFAQLLARRGHTYLDASVSGSSERVRQQQATLLVGGDSSELETVRPFLAALGQRLLHAGPPGYGARMKLATNLALGLHRAVLAEALAFGQAIGLQPTAVLQALRASPAYSQVMDDKGRKMLEGDYAAQARLSQHLKDVRLILSLGGASQAHLPLSTLHEHILEGLVQQGWGDADNAAVMAAYRRSDEP